MNTKTTRIFFFLLLANLASLAGAQPVTISLSPVGDPGNVADPLTGLGSVPYVYDIGTYDVTVGQYCQFLNAVAATDPYGLYNPAMAPGAAGGFRTIGIARSGASGSYSYAVAGSYSQAANCPIYDVTWGDAARFVNWLQNGEPIGAEGPRTTETGTYNLNGGTSNAALMAATRNPGSDWVLPTVNEWYKAAYYSGSGTDGGYWIYPTQSDNEPSNILSSTGTNNANFFNGEAPTDPLNMLTPVGAFAASPGAYGTYDVGGDVYQWNETPYGGIVRGNAGGGYASDVGTLTSEYVAAGGGPEPTYAGSELGFRVAYVPEPGSISMLVAAAAALIVIKLLSRLLISKRSESCCSRPVF
jgi:formylglycine-generating enzyme required for sulfatase activity